MKVYEGIVEGYNLYIPKAQSAVAAFIDDVSCALVDGISCAEWQIIMFK